MMASAAEDAVVSALRREHSSFRDPSGHLYWDGGEILRSVREPYRRHFEHAIASGLFKVGVDRGLLLPFDTVDSDQFPASIAVLKPQQLSFITYPYEWCFGQLRDAALATLDLHLLALDHGMLLKDASAYNIQFVDGRPVLIDHLSFDLLSDHTAWPAYGQFCRHFLAPLALMAHVDLGLGRLCQLHIDGVPLDLASKLLPHKTRFSPGLYLHLHLHAKMTLKHAGTRDSVVKDAAKKALSPVQLKAFAESLRSLVAKMTPKSQATEWGAYYCDTNYSEHSSAAKLAMVREMVAKVGPKTYWDTGGNDGRFARSLSGLVKDIVCLDIDPVAVGINYAACRKESVTNVLPLLFDCCNPAPAIGFANGERPSLLARGKPDLVSALALIHHLAISNNVPLGDIAKLYSDLTANLIIEFVGKEDSQVRRLLANRMDIFDGYTEDGFRASFAQFFNIVEERRIPDTHRILFLMCRKTSQKNKCAE